MRELLLTTARTRAPTSNVFSERVQEQRASPSCAADADDSLCVRIIRRPSTTTVRRRFDARKSPNPGLHQQSGHSSLLRAPCGRLDAPPRAVRRRSPIVSTTRRDPSGHGAGRVLGLARFGLPRGSPLLTAQKRQPRVTSRQDHDRGGTLPPLADVGARASRRPSEVQLTKRSRRSFTAPPRDADLHQSVCAAADHSTGIPHLPYLDLESSPSPNGGRKPEMPHRARGSPRASQTGAPATLRPIISLPRPRDPVPRKSSVHLRPIHVQQI